MKNKGLAFAVCLALMVLSFTSAFADGTETVSTITVKLGAQAGVEDMVNQVLDSAAIRIHTMPEGYGAFVVSLNGTDALQCLLKLEQDGIYAQSAMLGQTPLYFTWEDLQNFIMEQMQANAEMLGTNGMFDMDMLTSILDGSMTEEEFLQAIGIDEEFMGLINDIAASQTTEYGTYALNGSDVATTKTTLVITKEAIVRVINLPLFRNILAQQLTASYSGYTQEEIGKEVDAQLSDIQQAIEDSDLAVSITAYTTADSFKAMDFEMSGLSDYGTGSLSVILTKTTVEAAEFYQLSATVNDNGEEFLNQYGSLYIGDDFVSGKYTAYSAPDVPAFVAALNCDMAQPEHITGDLALTVYDSYYDTENTAFIVFDQQISDTATDTAIDLYTGGSPDEIKASLAASQMVTLNIHTVQQPDSGFFAALQNATPETSVQLLKMTETELDAYMQGMEQGLMMTLLTVMDNLPPELSNQLMQGMSGF